jgi:cell division transport system ATP-binding protein
MIVYKNISKIYPPNIVALSRINLEVKSGEFVFVVGSSGAGKSTLLKLLIREENPDEGEIYFFGENILKLPVKKIPFLRRQIGFIFQDFKLLPLKTVFENVAFALEVCGVPDKLIKQRVDTLLKIVGLYEKRNKFPHQISGGEQQRVSIARALAHNPKVLLADEPTGNLDPSTSWEIVELLLKINEMGTTILLATHDKEIVNKARKRVVVIENGQIVSDEKSGLYKLKGSIK